MPALDVADLGGKGAQTRWLADLGLPVPPSTVVPAEVYRSFAAQGAIRELVGRIRDGEAVEADQVDRCFLSVPVPPAVADAVARAGERLPGRLAVRSSATVEDLGDTSFAGQYRSLLDVGPEQLLDSVVLVWASLWHPAPCAYRRAHGIAEDDVAMAVLLMAMVEPVQAGVVFTLDPIGSARDLRVEAVDGSGEALVSGAVTPRCWSLRRDDLDSAPPPIGEAARLALEVEAAFGVPVDVEWAWDGTATWLVQARPITVVGAEETFDTDVDDHELTTAGITEMLPGVLPPLVWQLAGTALEEAFRVSFDAVGALDPDRAGPYGVLRCVRGRAAVDLDAVVAVAERLPGGTPGAVEHGYFGGEAPPPSSGPPWWGRVRRDLRVDAARRRAERDADVIEASVDALGAARLGLGELGDDELLARHRRLVDLGMRAMAAELGVAAAATAACDRVLSFVAGHLAADEAAHAVRRALTGVQGLPTPSWASMAVYAGPTWDEVGAVPATAGADLARGEAGRRALEDQLRALPRWRSTRVLTGQVVDVRLHLLRRLVADARGLLGRRERVKVAVLAIGGLLRAIHLELGARREAAGSLPTATDVDLLTVAELYGAAPSPTAVALGRRRRVVRRFELAGPLPERFVGTPLDDPVPAPVSGDRLEGIPASGGRAAATARVVRDPRHTRFRSGEVLVAAATDASWSPLFLDAAAIVVERGGPLSHAAIVARELGIPAVLDVPGATAVLGGRFVTVDGDVGVVVVHPEGRDAPGA